MKLNQDIMSVFNTIVRVFEVEIYSESNLGFTFDYFDMINLENVDDEFCDRLNYLDMSV